MRARIRTIVATLGIAVTAALAVPSPASAVPLPGEETPTGAGIPLSKLLQSGCGSACDQRDPQTFKIYYDGSNYATCATGRSGKNEAAYDIDSIWFASGTITLRYSPMCQTVWTRRSGNIYPVTKSYYMNGSKRTEARGPLSGTNWTAMLNDAGLLGQSCASDGPAVGCTVKY
ncbi:DUF2690 domain-containing protein [Micromonospora sp. NPDC005686]|uniref:DUF2690 domain-containing protein n=1 Tax=unclassified Micromonospora TaxID=2617518 RepID=UPI0033A7CA32